MSLDHPALVVQLGPLQQRTPQLPDRVERPHPEQLFLECADGALHAAIALRRSHGRRAGFDPEEPDLLLEVQAHVLRAVIVAQLKTCGDVLADRSKATPHGLAERLRRLPARSAFGRVDAEDPAPCDGPR